MKRKLTQALANEIRARAKAGESREQLAFKYKVSSTHISNIINSLAWPEGKRAEKRNLPGRPRIPRPPKPPKSKRRGGRQIHTDDERLSEIFAHAHGEHSGYKAHGKSSPCLVVHGIGRKKYARVKIWREGRQTSMTAARFVYTTIHGPLSNDYHVHHKCHVTRCVRPDHLQALKIAEHKRLHSSPIVAADVEEIRRLYAGGMSCKALAAKYGYADRRCIGQILRGERWGKE